MKAVFVYPNQTHQENIHPGLSYISSYLKLFGHQTALMDFTFRGSQKDCLEQVEKEMPDLVLFSLTTGDLRFSLELARKIRRMSARVLIVFGGAHPTATPETTIQYECVDLVCVGEGEYPTKILLDHLQSGEDYSRTPSYLCKRNGKIIRNALLPLETNLDKYPFPDRDIWNMDDYFEASHGDIDLIAGRGCPYHCTYCIIPHLNQINRETTKQSVRLRSPENIIEEVQYLRARYGRKVEMILFQDDVFALSKKWIRDFVAKFPKAVDIPFSCNGRVEALDNEMAEMLKRAGCVSLHMGIESGSEKIRSEVMRRNMTNEHIVNTFRSAKECGLKTVSYNIVGSPFETQEDYWKTIELNRECSPDFVLVSIFQPYPGTGLFELAKGKGWLDPEISFESYPVSHTLSTIMNYPDMSKRRIVWNKKLFRFRILRKTNWRAALFVLVLDVNYELFLKVRARIPFGVKRYFKKLVRSFYAGQENKRERTALSPAAVPTNFR